MRQIGSGGHSLSALNLYLERTRHDLIGGEATAPVTVVTGSGAADLDSIVASIAYAYLLTREGGLAGPTFPYLPIPGKDLPLRREVVRLFEQVGLKSENLVFADDVDLEELLAAREGELVLVDDQGTDLAPALCKRIAEVIDHHPVDQRARPKAEGRSTRDHASEFPAGNPVGASSHRPFRRRIVEPVGSACTLVAEQILQRQPEILDRQLATLLLAAVLLDTVNLDPDAGRVTEKDREIAGLLIQTGSAAAADLYEELVQARCEVGALSSSQLLARDFKKGEAEAVRFGMSSVPLLLDSWRRREERLEETLSGFLVENELDLLLVLLYQQGDGFKRQLVACTGDEHLLAHVVAGLTEPLGLVEISVRIHGGEGQKQPHPAGDRRVVIRSFTQRQASESRKRIEPRLREILESHEI
jgi:exopolyphosphatase